jgi:hypothetical protein
MKPQPKDQFNSILDDLQKSVREMQDMLKDLVKSGNVEISVQLYASINKMTSETLDRIYKIRYGKAAQEEIMLKIGELQRHLAKVETYNAERERRARSKPLMEIAGKLLDESEIIPDAEDGAVGQEGSSLTTPRDRSAAALRSSVEAGTTSPEDE